MRLSITRTLSSILSATCLAALSVSRVAAQIPGEFQGDWVSAQTSCEASTRFRVEAAKLTLINGADSESFGGVEMAGPAYWGPDYRGIMAVAISEFSGDQPVIATFNLDEKKGAAKVELAAATPGARSAASLALNARYTKLNLAKRFPLHAVPLKKCALKRASAQSVTKPIAAGASAPQSLCAGRRFCDEVAAFTATITDFRSSQYDRNTKAVSATIRFQNKTHRPLTLGYIRNAGVAIDEQGNRYTISDPANVRGIGEIAGGQFDPKFIVQPGQVSDARFEFWWKWNGRDIIGQRAWDVDLAVREVNEIAPGQYRFGQEHPLQFKGVASANLSGTSPATGTLASVAGGTASAGVAAPTPAAAASRVASNEPVAWNEPEACAGKPRCYDAGPFVAEIVNTVASRETYSRPWHTVRLNLRFRNKTSAPIILGYVHGTGVLIDDLGNRYAPSTAPEDAKGIGRVQANKADPQFVLRPGETRAATFGQARVMRGTPTATVIGSSYAFDVSIAQLEVIYNGQQVRTLREHSLTFPNFGLTGPGAAAPAATTPVAENPAAENIEGIKQAEEAAENIKKAGEAIQNIFKKKP